MPSCLWSQAQRGQPQALENLINRALAPRGLRVRVQRRARQLVIYCDPQASITPAQWTRFVQRGLQRLAYRSPQPVWLQGDNWQAVVYTGARSARPWLPWLLGSVSGVSLLVGGGLAYRWPRPIAETDPALAPATPMSPPPVIVLKAVGDVILGTDYPERRLHPAPQQLLQQVRAELAGADVVFGNLEAPLTTHPCSAKVPNQRSVFAFRMPPAYASLLRDAGFTLFHLANNHTGDFGEVGLRDSDILAECLTARGEANGALPGAGGHSDVGSPAGSDSLPNRAGGAPGLDWVQSLP
ncbi:MAG: CapA family protein [Gloeomargarita sp. SKYBB_i_bin120]|nr:CapA family protein [Gloeomargarita sp. SKYG98]MCS7292310.1 CapA family protein [Gloeomargarita sp. SKYB120]MDW8177870.1 CapA family protein [Gloeomargarita sp. SKYBB_i_bin120]